MNPIFIIDQYREYADTQIIKLTSDEIQKYMSERYIPVCQAVSLI